MKKIFCAMALVMLSLTPSYAFLDAIAGTAQAVREEIYEKFMMAKTIQELQSLRDNYVASMRYYEYFKQLNQGKGIIQNFAQDVADIGEQAKQEAQWQFQNDWFNNPAYNSDVDKLFNRMDNYASQKVRYAGKVFANSVTAEAEGKKLSAFADTMDPHSPQRAMVEGEAWNVELQAQTNANLSQLLDLNTRLYELGLEQKEERLRDWETFDKSVQQSQQRAGQNAFPQGTSN
jgi:hypothetical protein